jgi:hypothetical protein
LCGIFAGLPTVKWANGSRASGQSHAAQIGVIASFNTFHVPDVGRMSD